MKGDIEREMDKLITKPFLKKVIKKRILITRPELANQITDKTLVICLVYISGYIKCIQYHGIQPINISELTALLSEECYDWLIQYVDRRD